MGQFVFCAWSPRALGVWDEQMGLTGGRGVAWHGREDEMARGETERNGAEQSRTEQNRAEQTKVFTNCQKQFISYIHPSIPLSELVNSSIQRTASKQNRMHFHTVPAHVSSFPPRPQAPDVEGHGLLTLTVQRPAADADGYSYSPPCLVTPAVQRTNS